MPDCVRSPKREHANPVQTDARIPSSDCARRSRDIDPLGILGTEEGWEELDVSRDPEAESEAALDALGPAVEAIAAYWRFHWRTKFVVSKEANLRPRALRPGRNEPCPCGSGRKFKKCCAAGS
jgi:uncharacterized protein YchJ